MLSVNAAFEVCYLQINSRGSTWMRTEVTIYSGMQIDGPRQCRPKEET